MNFLKNLFKTDPGAGPMEKFVTYVVPIGVLILLSWLILASYGVGNSDLARAHETVKDPTSAAIWATLLYAAAIFWAWWNWTDRIPFRVNDIVATLLILVLLVLAVNANTGFFAHVR
jgi:drug/metabolite transporter (DMT)-like permease